MDASTILDRDTTLSSCARNAARTTSAALLHEWRRLTKVVSENLRGAGPEEGRRAGFLEEASAVRALAERDVDVAPYSLLFASGHGERTYGVTQSMSDRFGPSLAAATANRDR